MDMVKPEEKQMGAEGSGSVEKKMAEEDCDLYNGEHEMNDEEYLFYDYHLLKSDCFDVPAMPDVFSCGMIQPYDITGERQRIEVGRYAQLAIDEYNRRFEKKKGKLEFVKVLKAMCGVVAGVLYYITFDAKDLADGGTIKTYQSEVHAFGQNGFGKVTSLEMVEYSEVKRRFFRGDVLMQFKKVIGSM